MARKKTATRKKSTSARKKSPSLKKAPAKKKAAKRKYPAEAGRKVERAMHEMHEGKLVSGRSGKKVTSQKQAIAIGLSEARHEGAPVPKKAGD
jgi:Family of unknown function (DUF6496)